jgi:ribulose-phosphate 3-epimerase
MFEIIPSILTKDINEARQMIKMCDGITQRVQVDIIDGIFVNNVTVKPWELKNLDVFLGLDFHLMVNEPVDWVDRCLGVGADRIIGQIEMMSSQSEFVEKVEKNNLRLGLAIDLDTPVGKIEANLFEKLDVVLVMSVKAGFGSQKFEIRALDKVKELNKIRMKNKTPFRICVDGGETEEVIDDSVLGGADEVVIGRRLFKGDIAGNIKKMKLAAYGRN